MTEKNQKTSALKFDALFLFEKIKLHEQIVITMHDNDVIHTRLKWFTDYYLGTEDGKLINRRFVKMIG